jgi:dihydrofolate synthase/folylpolyglutamate synthase
VNAQALLPYFEAVEAARLPQPDGGAEVSLTYFEFTTLAILRCLAEAPLDVVILEVGLGGRLDTVNLVHADCAIITSIDLDHTELLGPDRESIGREKAGIFRPGQVAVISDPVPPQSVLQAASELGCDVWRLGVDYNFSGDQLQWSWAGRGRRYSGLAYPALRGANQLLNASGVLAALTGLRDRLPVTAQAVRNGLAMVTLPGRFQTVPGQPALVLDVAHNPHAVAALTANLDAMGFYPRTHAVLGAMADKDLSTMLARVGPLVDAWYFCDLPTPRAASAEQLAKAWTAWQSQLASPSERQRQVSVACFNTPQQALDAAALVADPADRIVVFGSFFTVGGVLQNGVPKLAAKHLGA